MDPVDLALVLALDGSASVTFEEFNLIAGGMAAALRDPVVVKGLVGGAAGASLACLLLWSGTGAQAMMIDWTRIATAADAAAFAQAVDDMPRGVRAGATAIGEALLANCWMRRQRKRRGRWWTWSATAGPTTASCPGRSATTWPPPASRSTASACCTRNRTSSKATRPR
jgi:hypothetical protein